MCTTTTGGCAPAELSADEFSHGASLFCEKLQKTTLPKRRESPHLEIAADRALDFPQYLTAA